MESLRGISSVLLCNAKKFNILWNVNIFSEWNTEAYSDCLAYELKFSRIHKPRIVLKIDFTFELGFSLNTPHWYTSVFNEHFVVWSTATFNGECIVQDKALFKGQTQSRSYTENLKQNQLKKGH